jgi:hypothetical protein
MLRLGRALFQQGNLPVMARAMGGAAAPPAVWSLGKLNHVAIAVGNWGFLQQLFSKFRAPACGKVRYNY